MSLSVSPHSYSPHYIPDRNSVCALLYRKLSLTLTLFFLNFIIRRTHTHTHTLSTCSSLHSCVARAFIQTHITDLVVSFLSSSRLFRLKHNKNQKEFCSNDHHQPQHFALRTLCRARPPVFCHFSVSNPLSPCLLSFFLFPTCWLCPLRSSLPIPLMAHFLHPPVYSRACLQVLFERPGITTVATTAIIILGITASYASLISPPYP